jgi:hypothetical protein
MKNVFLLPTDKPSRVYLIKSNNRLGLTSTNPEYMENFGSGTQNQHLYITSDEEIKEGDLFYDLDAKYIKIKQSWENSHLMFNGKKIILTTDGDLIKEGVQSIDDEFLQWYIKNPSCEEIGVLTNNMKNADYIEVAERLYKYINPTSKMDCPNSVYITTEKWYYEWLNIETDLDLFDWCIKFKNK